MAKKRATLVRNFDEIIESGDMKAFQAVFDRCDINATGGYAKGTALHFYGLTDEMICWVVNHGGNVNGTDSYNRTPLHKMASARGRKLESYLKLGADVNAKDCYGDTPLHFSASGCIPENVTLLLEHGANALEKNQHGHTPLLYALNRVNNADIAAFSEIAQLLLAVEPKITSEMRQCVTRIGETFEFYRLGFNPDYLLQTEAGLEKLYSMFGVEPVAKRHLFDGTSPIKVVSTTWQKQFNELWDLLVPGSGFASTVQGEVIRICGKVSREILDNGAVNWSRDYKKLPQALPAYCAMGNELASSDFIELERLAKGISANTEGKAFNRLTELVVKWVLLNPTPITLTAVEYVR